MNKFVKCFYCIIISSVFMCNFKNADSEEPIPLHLNYTGKYTSDIQSYEIVIPQRVNKDGNFISHLISHHHSKRSTKELELIFYKIPIAGKEYLIELMPNRNLISPGAVVEIHKEDGGKMSNRGLNASLKGEKIGKMFENLNIRKLENTECHFYGHVKGENDSKAALSTCYGLAGFIQIKKGFYTIEPVAEHDPFIEDEYPHILYKANDSENSSVCDTMRDLKASLADQVIRKRREINLSTPTYIETLIVMDKSLINYHENSDCENYVLTVFNMAFNLFNDASFGFMTTLTIVRIIRLEVENDEMNLKVNADAEKTLQYFQTWQYQINPGDDTHPNHHDVAILLTRVNVCYAPSSCGLLGLTTIGKACDPKLSAALCKDNGLRLGYVIAHEIGHLLGADHDMPNSTCNGTDSEGMSTVMQPHLSLTTQTWSKCTRAYIKTFFDSGLGSCLFDEPEDHSFNVQDMLPGVMYNADFQCKHLITMNAQECDMGSTCESLNCFVPGYACIITHNPPADGTRCGENMWCHNTKCIVVGERPGAIDGDWGEWSPWSDCTRTCGAGIASSIRFCDKPQPAHGGKSCIGERKRYKICAATITTEPHNISDLIRFFSEEVNVSFVGKPCETGRPSFRDIQCGEFNDWIYPEDGKIHTWKAYYFHDDNPCILYCISEEKQIAALRPRVVDGTMCYKGIRDICIGGTCKSLPCDLNFQSNAIEDACGICHGDGTACEFTEGMETLQKLTKGLTKLVNVPIGARNIRVEEMSPTLARIIVRDRDTRDIYVRGKTLGMFYVPGSQAWLGMTKKNQESLNIPGPVSKPLSIWIQRLENVTIKWSMALAAEQQRKPEFAWDFLKWGPCSAKCGPGTQKSEPSCMEEKAGLVEDGFCADLERPPTKVRRCEVSKCEPRWMVGDWKGCDQPPSEKKERKRVVYCIKPLGEGEGESQIVDDNECPSPKPHDKEPCENRQKREDTEYKTDTTHYEDGSMYRSNTVEFGYHKKYDDYLTHFAALSVPQRKSETIPLHLLSSPHFKDYFRVLENPDYDAENISDISLDINLTNNSLTDSQTQNKVSPDFYRNTFSGNQVDVSHIQLKGKVKKRNTIPTPKKRNLHSFIEKKKKFFAKLFHKKQRPQDNNVVSNSNSKPKSLYKRWNSQSPMASHHTHNLRQIYLSTYPSGRMKNRYHMGRKLQQQNQYSLSSRDVRNLRGLLLSSKRKKNFNFSTQNLTNFIENLSGGNNFIRNYYLNLIDKMEVLTPFEKNRLRDYQSIAYNRKNFPDRSSVGPKTVSEFASPNKLEKSVKFNDAPLDRGSIEKPHEVMPVSGNRKLFSDEFDGSGVKKVSFESMKFSTALPAQETVGERPPITVKRRVQKRKLIFNPHNYKQTARPFFDPRKPILKKYQPLENMSSDRRIKRFYPPRLQEKRSIYPSHRRRKASPLNFETKAQKKRSSHKRKKSKTKDPISKTNKDLSSSGSGTERRNYLNNLFRDSHPKVLANKQEQKQPIEKPVIDAGRLVIDKDYPDRESVEIVFQDDENDATNFTHLPHSISDKNLLTLRGEKVFDLFQALRDRRDREAFLRPYNNGSTSFADVIEINVKIPKPVNNGNSGNNDDMSTKTTPSAPVSVGSSQNPAVNKKASIEIDKDVEETLSLTIQPPQRKVYIIENQQQAPNVDKTQQNTMEKNNEQSKNRHRTRHEAEDGEKNQQSTSTEKTQQPTSTEKTQQTTNNDKTQTTSNDKTQQPTSTEKTQQTTNNDKTQTTSNDKTQQPTSTEKTQQPTSTEKQQTTNSDKPQTTTNSNEKTQSTTEKAQQTSNSNDKTQQTTSTTTETTTKSVTRGENVTKDQKTADPLDESDDYEIDDIITSDTETTTEFKPNRKGRRKKEKKKKVNKKDKTSDSNGGEGNGKEVKKQEDKKDYSGSRKGTRLQQRKKRGRWPSSMMEN